MLSDVSPFRPMKSGTCSGLIPRRSLDPLGRVDVDVGDAARGHHQRDVVADELEGVAVGRDHGGLDPRFVGAVGERGDHVVGLPAFELEVAVAEGLDDRPEVRELLAQQVRHRLALDLVGLELLGAVHGPRVPGHGDALRPVVGEQLEEHVREAEQRVRGEALARGELLRQRVEGAVGEVVAVDQEEVGVSRGRRRRAGALLPSASSATSLRVYVPWPDSRSPPSPTRIWTTRRRCSRPVTRAIARPSRCCRSSPIRAARSKASGVPRARTASSPAVARSRSRT